ncbi:MAG: glycosyltransferase family 2 protein [Oscillospiraceae bacterium]|nr:glycosyltransferase family 2 protein [Oscillospiraceae bacterium]
MKTLVVIPAYNEQDNIKRVVNNLTENYPQFDYIIVNDGSKDQTSAICHRNNYNIIDLPVNLGLRGAFQAGLKYAHKHGYEKAVQFDADGQHLPQFIQPMADCMEETRADIVIGSRFVNEKKPKSLRMIGSRVISLAVFLTTGKKLTDPTSGMRMFNSKMIAEFARDANYAPEPDTISYLIKNGAAVNEVQVQMRERIAGESYLNPVNRVKYMIKMVISIVLIQWLRGEK